MSAVVWVSERFWWTDEWPAFFREQRLAPQVEMATERDRWRSGWDRLIEALYRRLPEMLPATPEPSVLHGDLWAGNDMVTAVGDPALIDPATYYGHREADLAMTELFGGYDDAFYDAYRSMWGWSPATTPAATSTTCTTSSTPSTFSAGATRLASSES